MTTIVVDASVAVKWLFSDDAAEENRGEAAELLRGIGRGRFEVVQPPHWLAEVAAVVTRLDPSIAGRGVSFLHAMEFRLATDVDVYHLACKLGAALGHHVFDTLYHAVALTQPEATLVTADRRYYRKARRLGRIKMLSAFAKG